MRLKSVFLSAVNYLWELKVPSSIALFGWRFLMNRLPTKDQLYKRGITMDRSCVLYGQEDESLSHLFDSCGITDGIWMSISSWLGNNLQFSLAKLKSFFHNSAKISNRPLRITVAVVWLATVWSLWLNRNDIIFNNTVSRSWYWMFTYYNISIICNFSYWNTNPLLCYRE